MGRLIDGIWHEVEPARAAERGNQQFRGTLDDADGLAAPGRYHLYASYACPWAHRALVVRALKGLEQAVPVSMVHWHLGDEGWRFTADYPDDVNGFTHLREAYQLADPHFTGRVTVPVLWDRARGTIVNNESADVVRILNRQLDAVARHPERDLYPPELAGEIDRVNARVFETVNAGVYKAGFARRQADYEAAYDALFDTLDGLEARLDRQPYLAGDRLTEADVRLFTTLVRFDPVYHTHFKCNRHRLVDYPNLHALTREIYQLPGVRETVDVGYIKRHYYRSHTTLNPTGIVPKGPALDLESPHGRSLCGRSRGVEAIAGAV